jgi:hypothetical protein
MNVWEYRISTDMCWATNWIVDRCPPMQPYQRTILEAVSAKANSVVWVSSFDTEIRWYLDSDKIVTYESWILNKDYSSYRTFLNKWYCQIERNSPLLFSENQLECWDLIHEESEFDFKYRISPRTIR